MRSKRAAHANRRDFTMNTRAYMLAAGLALATLPFVPRTAQTVWTCSLALGPERISHAQRPGIRRSRRRGDPTGRCAWSSTRPARLGVRKGETKSLRARRGRGRPDGPNTRCSRMSVSCRSLGIEAIPFPDQRLRRPAPDARACPPGLGRAAGPAQPDRALHRALAEPELLHQGTGRGDRGFRRGAQCASYDANTSTMVSGGAPGHDAPSR